jgi:hypothetical protein
MKDKHKLRLHRSLNLGTNPSLILIHICLVTVR